ncbi:hypothetical protein [Kribbella sp. DT2]|uniref:hypothetical protein n=1 Tax=Kribbella sp. DT2 TaxID=3393427 RepID=UPI003CEAC374
MTLQRRGWSALPIGLLALVVAVIGLTAVTPTIGAVAAPTSTTQPAADSPTPTLGSTVSPAANPPGSADGDTSDWSGMRWLFLGLLIPVLFIGGVILAKRRSRASTDRRHHV